MVKLQVAASSKSGGIIAIAPEPAEPPEPAASEPALPDAPALPPLPAAAIAPEPAPLAAPPLPATLGCVPAAPAMPAVVGAELPAAAPLPDAPVFTPVLGAGAVPGGAVTPGAALPAAVDGEPFIASSSPLLQPNAASAGAETASAPSPSSTFRRGTRRDDSSRTRDGRFGDIELLLHIVGAAAPSAIH
jgi:hypothetical protein